MVPIPDDRDGRVIMFTDGACRGNPGPGGWGVVLRYQQHEKRLCGFESHTTNNRMELTAVIRGLRSLKRPCQVSLTTDSSYVKNGITRWIVDWKRRGWRKADGSKVENIDLWQQLEAAALPHRVDWQWVRGHAGNPDNELADQLAREGLQAGLRGELPPDDEVSDPGETMSVS